MTSAGRRPTIEAVRDAAARIAPHAHRTPVMTCATFDAMTGARLYFKCENFQKVGAFKFRGACNAVFGLSDPEAANGVVTHSSGNHAQALALAAKLRGIPAYIVMPEDAPDVKKAAVAGYSAEITFCAPTLRAREETAARVEQETGAAFIHPYNDDRIIAGQGTAALELMEDVSDFDMVLAPVGGGGLLSGTAIAAAALSPASEVIGVEPAGADDAARSFRSGQVLPSENPATVADGLLTSLGDKTFPIIQELVSDIVTVDDDAIVRAMRLVWERMKVLIEPSAAVSLAAVLEGAVEASGKRIGVVFSGGNVDLDRLPW